MKCCPTCEQSIERVRHGVRFSKTMCRIIDLVSKRPGISGVQLRTLVNTKNVNYKWACIYVAQINKRFEEADKPIRLVGQAYSGYRLVDRSKKK